MCLYVYKYVCVWLCPVCAWPRNNIIISTSKTVNKFPTYYTSILSIIAESNMILCDYVNIILLFLFYYRVYHRNHNVLKCIYRPKVSVFRGFTVLYAYIISFWKTTLFSNVIRTSIIKQWNMKTAVMVNGQYQIYPI